MIAFPQGSVPELVEEGVTGFVVETVDEMVRLVRRDLPLARFDRRRCRLRAVERFGRARMAADYERCYARAMAARAGSRAGSQPGASIRIA